MFQKLKKVFVCSKCDAQFPKWLGQCSECGAWGTIIEKTFYQEEKEEIKAQPGKTIEFSKVKSGDYPRLRTEIEELDRVLGGGIVPGSLVLLGGEPGIGKSTLVLQVADALSRLKQSILYISGEESGEQIKSRMERLGVSGEKILFLSETNIEIVCQTIKKEKPNLAIIDSIQTMYNPSVSSEPGSVSQVRLSTALLMNLAKKEHISIFIIGHVTKEGMVAGPKTLEHLVDTVLYLEGDTYHYFRILRAVKNRFGPTNETGVFDLKQEGLVEIKNPSQVFLSFRKKGTSGSVISAILQGTRIFLVEVQALVNKTIYGYPQRRAMGIDFNRLQLLVAVLSRRCNLALGNFDIHLNIAGGIKVEEPSVDLSVCLSIVSAFKNKPIDSELIVFGEVGLSGEVRPVGFTKERVKEAAKLGFKKIILPAGKERINVSGIKIIEVLNLAQALQAAF